MIRLISLATAGLFWASAGAALAGQSAPTGGPVEQPEAVAENLDLLALFQEERQFFYSENPGTGPSGERLDVPIRLAAVSAEDQERRGRRYRAFRARLTSIRQSDLNDADSLNAALFDYYLRRPINHAEFRLWRIPMFSDSGFHTWPTRLWQRYRFETVEDFERYLQLLSDLPRYLRDHQRNLQRGIDDGYVMARVVLEGLLPSFTKLASLEGEDSPFFGPFLAMPDAIDEDHRARLKTAAFEAIAADVTPAYQSLERFMRGPYRDAATTTLGVSDLPGGAAYYREAVTFYTTLDTTAEAVHQTGLREVARIRAEMQDVLKQANFDGSIQDFIAFLRSDPQFYARSVTELLMHASFLAKKIDLKMPLLFGRLPRQPYGVEAVPASIAPNYTTGRYVGAPLDAPRGGTYWVNTYALDKRPLYNLPSLTLHEAAPGHHHQIALSLELENVPEFRRSLYPNAYGEGWGLYAEKLGLEIGLYTTPYEHFGRLSYEMWRACRLVIDTGIHTLGWSREEAIEYLASNTALSTLNVRTEVDRYISWPGQALSYKMGELTILALRARAEAALGDRFDLRAFHDEILSEGGMPLGLLQKRIHAWIDQQQAVH